MLAVFALACSAHGKSAGGDTTSAAAAPDANVSPQGLIKGKVHLQVGSGPHAGTYDATMTDGGCSHGLGGRDRWGNHYQADESDPKAFTTLLLDVADTKAAAAGTSAFQLTAGFGPPFGDGGTKYKVNTLPNGKQAGSGTVTVQDKGQTATVTFEATSADGVALKGTIECDGVIRAG
jgi:hypothetical protein